MSWSRICLIPRILTADYIMANPFAAEIYGGRKEFENNDDPFEFRPTAIYAYYGKHSSKVTRFSQEFGRQVISHGTLRMDIPHAGVLNTNAFLHRYPSTATNRNRARARWTYYHFLGLDVEKSASRTTDPVALADTDNPTMHNAACTVCHAVLDPVAGAFQNYGNEGYYRQNYGGLGLVGQVLQGTAGRFGFALRRRRYLVPRHALAGFRWPNRPRCGPKPRLAGRASHRRSAFRRIHGEVLVASSDGGRGRDSAGRPQRRRLRRPSPRRQCPGERGVALGGALPPWRPWQ